MHLGRGERTCHPTEMVFKRFNDQAHTFRGKSQVRILVSPANRIFEQVGCIGKDPWRAAREDCNEPNASLAEFSAASEWLESQSILPKMKLGKCF